MSPAEPAARRIRGSKINIMSGAAGSIWPLWWRIEPAVLLRNQCEHMPETEFLFFFQHFFQHVFVEVGVFQFPGKPSGGFPQALQADVRDLVGSGGCPDAFGTEEFTDQDDTDKGEFHFSPCVTIVDSAGKIGE